jgi:DNA/RNA-binding domain of Phe-tRNA-synthetase-like protein
MPDKPLFGTPRFGYDRAVLDAFPTIRAAVVEIDGVEPGGVGALEREYLAQQSTTAEWLDRTPIAEIASVSAWRRAFSRFGVKPTQHRSAVEALLRRLSKQGEVPSINPLVDMGNLVSIRHSLPVAVFDLDEISPPITVRFASGDELFHGIGTDGPEQPAPGEVVFIDARASVCARRWCWRQSALSAAGRDTTRALVVIEGHHESASEDVMAAGKDVADLATRHLHATVGPVDLLSPERPFA